MMSVGGGVSTSASTIVGKRTLAAPAIQSAHRAYSRDGGDEKEKEKDKVYVEANNAVEAGQKNKVTCSMGGQDAWIDYVPSPVMRVVFTSAYAAVGCEDGNVVVYSMAGRQ
jgi:protein HIRA/HIR1